MSRRAILITGGAGFIGSNLVAGLQERGETELVVSDRLRQGSKWKNLRKQELADLVHPDGLDDWLTRRGDDLRAVFHMGAVSSTTETDADRIIENNFRLSLRLWRWCARHQVPLIYASSAATYGDGARGFDDDAAPEHLATLRPLNPYGWSKHLFDRRVARIAAEDGLAPPQWAGLKFFNVYGPNEHHKGEMRSVVTKKYPVAAEGGPVKLFRSEHPDYPDGGQMRDFVYVKDCVDVMLWLLDHPEVSGLFNVGTGRARTWDDLMAALFDAVGLEPNVEYVEMPDHLKGRYQYFTEAETSKLRDAGYDAPFRSVEEGVRDYVEGHLATDDPFR